MAIKKPTRRVMPVGEASMTLMGNQDTRNEEDSTSRKKGECITFWGYGRAEARDEHLRGGTQHHGIKDHHRRP